MKHALKTETPYSAIERRMRIWPPRYRWTAIYATVLAVMFSSLDSYATGQAERYFDYARQLRMIGKDVVFDANMRAVPGEGKTRTVIQLHDDVDPASTGLAMRHCRR